MSSQKIILDLLPLIGCLTGLVLSNKYLSTLLNRLWMVNFINLQKLTLDVMNGYNGTIFAYGQTGSGKTFTMMARSFTNS